MKIQWKYNNGNVWDNKCEYAPLQGIWIRSKWGGGLRPDLLNDKLDVQWVLVEEKVQNFWYLLQKYSVYTAYSPVTKYLLYKSKVQCSISK